MSLRVRKPSKQRKLLYQSPAHKIRKLLSAPLSGDLRKSQGRRSYPVRKGDTVKIVRGDFAGIEGKITKVDTHRQRIFVEGVQREKVAGTSENVSVHSSKVVITKLNLDDKWRAESVKVTPAVRAAGKEA
jgi:large subunit ribosomal protein L24